jgi:hypothetical protein
VISFRALTTAALVVVLAGFVGVIVDYAITHARLPPQHECRVWTEECGDAQNAWVERARALESDFRERSWVYAVAVLAGALGLTAVALLRTRAPSERQRVYANLGVGGVVLALIVTALFWLANTLTIQPAADSAYVPSMVMLAVAAVGGLYARAESGRPLEVGGRRTGWARNASLAGLGFTAVTLVLAFSGEPNCTTGETIGPTGYIFWSALATSAAAGLLALLGLLGRRWVLSLVCFVGNAALLLFITVGCWAG